MMQARESESLTEALQAAKSRKADDRLEPLRIPARSGPEQFNLIRENLGRIELTDGLRIEEALFDSLPHIDRWQVLVVLTAEAGDDFINGILRARMLGYRVMVFVVCQNIAYDRCQEFLMPHGVEVFRTDETWRMKEIATGRRFF